jgi:hypothetical protein
MGREIRRKVRVCRGRAIAQAVCRRFPTAAARVRAQVRSCGICGGQSGTGAGFLLVLRYPLPILIPSTTPHSSSLSIIRDWYNRPISGRSTKWTQSHRQEGVVMRVPGGVVLVTYAVAKESTDRRTRENRIVVTDETAPEMSIVKMKRCKMA